jgi:hypothetical protein
VAIPPLYNPANYGRFSVWFLSPGGSYPPVYMVVLIPVQRLQVQGQEFSGSRTCFSQPVQVCNRVRLWSLVAVVVAEEGEGLVLILAGAVCVVWEFALVQTYACVGLYLISTVT